MCRSAITYFNTQGGHKRAVQKKKTDNNIIK